MVLRLVVFTDLDGTLLDHATYGFDDARPALDTLKRLSVPLVLASSKTAAEIAPLHDRLGLGACPAIIENGAGVYRPDMPPGANDADAPSDYHRLRRIVGSLPARLAANFTGFGDLTDHAVAEITGLPLEDARNARCRQFSEPGLWAGNADGLQAFLDALAGQGVSARRGGRFLTLSFGGTKADRMRMLADELGANTTLALGDAPNDAEMLELASHGVLIRNDHAPTVPPLAGEANGRIRRSETSGPAAWNAAVLTLLAELGLNQADPTHG